MNVKSDSGSLSLRSASNAIVPDSGNMLSGDIHRRGAPNTSIWSFRTSLFGNTNSPMRSIVAYVAANFIVEICMFTGLSLVIDFGNAIGI